MIAVDTNLLVYAHHPEMAFHERARQVLTEAVTAPEPVCVPWPCAHEFLAVVSNPRIFRDPTPVDVVLDAIRRLLASLSGGFLAEGEGNMLSEGQVDRDHIRGKVGHRPTTGNSGSTQCVRCL